MPVCACGCGRQTPSSKTRPARYYSRACKALDYRRRKQLLQSTGVASLIADAERVVKAWDAFALGDTLLTRAMETEMFESMQALSLHPLLAGSQAGEPDGNSSLHPLAGIRIGNDAGQGGEEEDGRPMMEDE